MDLIGGSAESSEAVDAALGCGKSSFSFVLAHVAVVS
jgi:hypothetical protein